jgi:diguanylate cyclase (GGDEF)-like protein
MHLSSRKKIKMDNQNKYSISILYVEDEHSIREGYAKALSRLCDKLYIAENGKDGLDLYKKYRPNIIVSDIKMPIMNGIEMVREIKKINPNECCIIFTTAHSDNGYLFEALELQVSSYLLKPVQKNILKSKIENLSSIIIKEKVNKDQKRQIEEQKVILQNILNTEKNLLIVTDFKEVLFANNAFLESFEVKNVNEFNQKCDKFLNIFLPLPNYLHQGLINENESFYDLINKTDESKRSVTLISTNANPKAYHVNISQIKHKNRDSYLISLTDITKMSIEKIYTEKKAYFDGLTGVYNRNKFNELFDLELKKVKQHHHKTSLVIVDIDHFKKINDIHGHLVGDEVLILIAQTMKKSIRDTDIFARWGGEEFAILLPYTDISIAKNRVEELRSLIQNTPHKSVGNVTASFGVTELTDEDCIKSAFKRCDEALYLAKENGRNRVETLPKVQQKVCQL